ncbi:MAG: hypothetical protein RR721_08465 [Aeromonas sp.]|uniref:hypothetical protein n=1 Tax=Aeromonas sp. TaxID=647 RepID=UPI002FC99359
MFVNFVHAVENVYPGKQEIIIHTLKQHEYEFLSDGILPHILTEQDPLDGTVRFRLSAKDRTTEPFFIDAELWLKDGSGKRISLSNQTGMMHLATVNPVGARILADITDQSLMSLKDGVYSLAALVRWSDKDIQPLTKDFSVSGFKETDKLEIKGDRADIDITALFKSPNIDSISVPLQLCLLPESTQYANVFILENTELSHSVDRVVTLPYKMELIGDNSLISMQPAVLTPGQPVMVPSLDILYSRGLSKNVRCIDYRLVFSLSERSPKNIRSGSYRQNQTIVLSQSV